MLETDVSKARRSTRVFYACARGCRGKKFRRPPLSEACETVVINAHGGLMYLNQPLNMDAVLVITKPFTQEEQECRIVFLGDATDKGQRIGLEFLTPAPHFWGVDYRSRGLAPAACRRSPELIPLCVSAVSHAHSASSFPLGWSL